MGNPFLYLRTLLYQHTNRVRYLDSYWPDTENLVQMNIAASRGDVTSSLAAC